MFHSCICNLRVKHMNIVADAQGSFYHCQATQKELEGDIVTSNHFLRMVCALILLLLCCYLFSFVLCVCVCVCVCVYVCVCVCLLLR